MASIDLDHLRVFQRVAQTRSFSRAAALLRLDRTRVSRVIAALERELGVRLFERTTRNVTPTQEGEALARRIAAPLQELEGAVATVPAQAAIPTGEVTITATADLGRALLAPLLARFRRRFPAVRIQLTLTDAVIGAAHGVDLALRFGRSGTAGQVARAVGKFETAFYAAPSYLDTHGTPTSLAELASHDGLWPMMRGRRSFAPSVAPPPPAISCDDFGALAELARAGAGIAVLPTFVASVAVAGQELVPVLPGVTLGTAPLYLISAPPARLPLRVTALRQFLLDALVGLRQRTS